MKKMALYFSFIILPFATRLLEHHHLYSLFNTHCYLQISSGQWTWKVLSASFALLNKDYLKFIFKDKIKWHPQYRLNSANKLNIDSWFSNIIKTLCFDPSFPILQSIFGSWTGKLRNDQIRHMKVKTWRHKAQTSADTNGGRLKCVREKAAHRCCSLLSTAPESGGAGANAPICPYVAPPMFQTLIHSRCGGRD